MIGKLAGVFYEVGYKVNDSGLKKADGELKKVGEKVKGAKGGTDELGSSLLSIGNKVAGVVAVGAVVGTLVTKINNATNEFAKFDYQLARVNAKGDKSVESFKVLKTAAFEAGKVTVFSSTQSAKGLEYMAMAGWSAVESAKALPAVLDTAIVAGEDLALVSDIMTDTMTVFKMGASEANKFADILAYSADKSNTSIGMMGEAMKYAAPPMSVLGSTAEETAALFMSMADGGIKASQAGTTLRSSALNLVNPTKEMQRVMRKLRLETKDSSGNFIGMTSILDQLEQKTKGMTNAQKAQTLSILFGKDAVSGIMVAMEQGTEKIKRNTEALKNNNGYARKSAEYMASTLQGQILATASKQEALSMAVGETFAPFKLAGVKLYNKGLDKLLEILTPTEETLLAIEGSIIVVGNAFEFMGKAIDTALIPLKYISDSKIFKFYKDILTMKYPREFLSDLAFGEEGLKGNLANVARQERLETEVSREGKLNIPKTYIPKLGAPTREKTIPQLAGFGTGGTVFSPTYGDTNITVSIPQGTDVNNPNELGNLFRKTLKEELELRDKKLMNQINPRRR